MTAYGQHLHLAPMMQHTTIQVSMLDGLASMSAVRVRGKLSSLLRSSCSFVASLDATHCNPCTVFLPLAITVALFYLASEQGQPRVHPTWHEYIHPTPTCSLQARIFSFWLWASFANSSLSSISFSSVVSSCECHVWFVDWFCCTYVVS
jgi:hypothetical protein